MRKKVRTLSSPFLYPKGVGYGMEKKQMTGAIIVAAGKGKRMGTKISKQFLKLEGKEILAHTLDVFETTEMVDEIIIVTGQEDICYIQEEIVEKYGYQKVKKVVAGGKERQDSVKNGMLALSSPITIVLVHDGVRPFIRKADIEATILQAEQTGACILGVRAKDTIKRCRKDQVVEETPNRNFLWYIQTPQTFRKDILFSAYEKAEADGFYGTDESSLVERTGFAVQVVEGHYDNIKITTAEDLLVAKAFLLEGERG